ncbi:AraC-like DNA-binding protein [Xanthomonas arboricola]
MTDPPAPQAAGDAQPARADILSQLLTLIRLQGDGVYSAELAAGVHARVPAGPSHLHFVEAGSLWITADGGAPLQLQTGDLVVLPHGHGHTLSQAQRPARSAEDFFAADRFDPARLKIRHGEGAAMASVIGGIFRYERLPLPPIMRALPTLIHIPGDAGRVPEWLRLLSHFLMAEAHEVRPGAQLMVSRIIDLLVIRALRSWAELHPQQSRWLTSAAGERVGLALHAIHADPYRRWSVEQLGRHAGLSRSLLAQQFVQVTGEPPMRYIALWRLSVADDLIRSGNVGVGDAARRVGYQSEAGFSRAFKAYFGHAPKQVKP